MLRREASLQLLVSEVLEFEAQSTQCSGVRAAAVALPL